MKLRKQRHLKEYLGIKLTKVKILHTENSKALLKEIKECLNKWEDIQCLWTEKLSITKKIVFPKLIYRFTEILVKIQGEFFFFQ